MKCMCYSSCQAKSAGHVDGACKRRNPIKKKCGSLDTLNSRQQQPWFCLATKRVLTALERKLSNAVLHHLDAIYKDQHPTAS